MTQYFYVDESGDAGLEGQASSSSHFVMAMVQLPERARLQPIADLRKASRVSPSFEYKYHKSTPKQKERFFKDVLKIPLAGSMNKTPPTILLGERQPQLATLSLGAGKTVEPFY